MRFESTTRMRVYVAAVVAALVGAVAVVAALGTGQSFLFLESGYQQELYGAIQLPEDADGFATVLGGVAFAPDGDAWVADCLFGATTLHRFDAQTTSVVSGTSMHPSSDVPTQGGCGLTNHPDSHLYSNSSLGIFRLDSSTGLPVSWPDGGSNPRGHAGNALGITVDPKTTHIVYAGDGCHPSLAPGEPNCTIYDLDPTNGAVTSFATLSRTDVPFVDGIYFDPTGTFLFMANRGGAEGVNFLTVLRRPEASLPNTALPQIVQSVLTPSEPDGVAFHAASPKYVITNDEDNGTMTKITFPGDDYTMTPTVTMFASGGHRGDLLQVGADGCIYATQGRAVVGSDFGTRYDDGTETTEDSIVRICAPGGGFTPPTGVTETVHPPVCTSHIGDFIWSDLNGNGIQDAGEPGIPGVLLTVRDAVGSPVKTATTDANGGYGFDVACGGTYTLDIVGPGGYATTVPLAGNPAVDSNNAPAVFTLANTETTDTSFDFGFVLGKMAGTVFVDANRNGTRDAGEAGLAGVTVTLSGALGGTAVSAGDGTYAFSALRAGNYAVGAPAVASGFGLSSSASLPVTLAAGQTRGGLDFGYAPARLSGVVYSDLNKNGSRDAGEPGIGGVAIGLTGASSASATTAADGSYSFIGLLGGSYSISSPLTASGLARGTASPLAASPAPGQFIDNLNFGYISGSIAGFAYADYNKNGLREATEPGLPGVVIALTGAASATATTAGDGSYSFKNLSAGTYTVAAPSSAAGLTRSTASPLTVILTAGQNTPNINFGYTETTAPTCAEVSFKGPPFHGTMTFQDTGGGIASLTIITNINFKVVMPTFTAPSKAALAVSATRIDETKSATLTVKATDIFGNSITCDPVVTTITKLRHEKGTQTFTDLPYAEHIVTIQNDNPGLRALDVVVNGTSFLVRNLDDLATRVLDVSSAMKRGNHNTIQLVPRGKKGDSATVTIGDN